MADESHGEQDDLARLFVEREAADSSPSGDRPTMPRPEAPAGETTSASALDATFMYEEQQHDKKESDVAFAVACLQSGIFTEKKLAKAVIDWTVHGDLTLADHLIAKSLLSEDAKQGIKRRADEALKDASSRADSQFGNAVYSSTIDAVDPTGKVARILGLDAAQQTTPGSTQREAAIRFRLLRRLGQGGMGTVWLARDEELGRLVAIKEIQPAAAHTEVTAKRFRREAEVTGRLEHPNIVPVHQFAQDRDSAEAFYVMRFLGKRTLEDAIVEYHERRESGDADPMHLHHLLTAFVTVCQAIAYAHSRDVVHRDLKPENIALDDYGQVIVLDWGLAKLTGRAEQQELLAEGAEGDFGASPDQSSAGQVLGTPMYMAPEQAAGRSDEIDTATDVYGLGAILYAILTGSAPHESTRSSLSMSTSVTELLQAIVSRDPRPATELNPDAPLQLEAICAKAMATRRYARYDSALDLADDVQRFMAGEPVSTFREPWRIRLWRWIGKHRRTSQLLGVLLAVSVVSAAILGITSRQNQLSRRQSQFESLKADGRELEVSLKSNADDLARNARFMAALPPIQAIINARQGIDTDPEEVWLERLQTIYRGLLEANPEYLSASYVTAGETFEEIVRVERHHAAGFVRVVPSTRLDSLTADPTLSAAMARKPGDVSIATARFGYEGDPRSSVEQLVLTAAVPVYDEIEGKLFGVVLIEADLEEIVRDLLLIAIDAGENAFLTNGEGRVLLHFASDGEFRRANAGKSIGQFVDGVDQLFQPDRTAETLSLDQRAYAIRMPLDPEHDSAWMGFVLALEN